MITKIGEDFIEQQQNNVGVQNQAYQQNTQLQKQQVMQKLRDMQAQTLINHYQQLDNAMKKMDNNSIMRTGAVAGTVGGIIGGIGGVLAGRGGGLKGRLIGGALGAGLGAFTTGGDNMIWKKQELDQRHKFNNNVINKLNDYRNTNIQNQNTI